MKQVIFFFAVFFTTISWAQNAAYKFSIDLTKVNNDMVQVFLDAPEIKLDKIIYNIPKMVPGTYRIYDFGQYSMDFEAFDKKGYAMSVTRLDDNRWEIDNAKNLAKISYWVEDTWDAKVKDLVFEPGGTNIEKDENIVLNNHGFFGYFDGLKNLKYELTVTRPDNFYGATGLTDIKTIGNKDVYYVNNYMDLVDSPIMYNVPDTTVIEVGGADILISVYAKNKTVTSKEIAKNIASILEAQKNYLGGKLPIDKYAFIIYLYAGQSGSGGSGALEHSYSSFYYLPEMTAERISGFLIDVAAHEFFHIVTPLNIHSEEIGDFDYINPKMSKHLWMYEGVTEYFAGHVQVYEGLISKDEYLEVIQDKIKGASYYKDNLPFTAMSLGCLDEHEKQYGNVYQKGALIGMCLDILLREYSKGEMGMKDMMAMLSKEYGKNVSFKDEELFDKIASLSSQKIREFFKMYVEGESSLPLEELLNKVGITYKTNVTVKEVSMGGASMSYNEEIDKIYVVDTGNMDEFGKSLGYKNNDIIYSINGVEITADNVKTELARLKNTLKEGDKIEVVVGREVKGKSKNVTLKSKAMLVEKTKKYFIEFNPSATPQQLTLQKAWLNTKM
ncbi:MAG: peptidase M61 [Flavobacteriales bacterium]|nr:peptidase M61 [Flavobacteriales bacterium]